MLTMIQPYGNMVIGCMRCNPNGGGVVNSNKLKKAINRKGLKIRYIAEKLGISHEAMYNKVKGKTEFKASEISALIDLLDLTANDVFEIFFARKVG